MESSLSQNFFDYLPTEIKSLVFYWSVLDCNKKVEDPQCAPTLCLVSFEFRDIMEILIKPRVYKRLSFSYTYTYNKNRLMGNSLNFAEIIDLYACPIITDDMLLTATRLKSLNLTHSSIVTQGCISQLTNLTRLSFNLTPIVFIDGVLKNLTNLTSLYLMTNAPWANLCCTSSISHLTKLTSLGFHKDRIKLDELSFYTNITHLKTDSNTTITDEILARMSKLTMLKMVRATQLSPITDKGLTFLTNCKSLQLIHVANTKITDFGISSMTQLKSLSIDKTHFTDDSLKGLTNLTSLIINRNCNITVRGLKSCPKLKLVSVAHGFKEKFSADVNQTYMLQIIKF